MSFTTRYRALTVLLAVTAALSLSSATLGSAVASTPAQPVTSLATATVPTVPAGHDYASTTFGDPWDYGNSSDLVLDTGPAWGLTKTAISGGMAYFTMHSGYVSPLWGGYGTEVPIEREGTRSGNALDTRVYTRMQVHVYATVLTGAALSWYTCGALSSACNGQMNFTLRAGWNDIDLPIVRTGSAGKAWAGPMVGLRLALAVPTPGVSAIIHLDNLRLYQPLSTSAITWAAPGAAPATLWWTDATGTSTASASQHSGPVANAPRSAKSSSPVTANVAGYAPGTQFWAVSGGTPTLVGAIAPAPLPVIDSPSAAGCVDYATAVLKRPWTFTSSGSLAARANIGALSFTPAGELSATNAAPQRNDPSITLPIAAGGINGRVYHRLTIVESYDGPFNLRNAPGGGTMARVLWQSPGHSLLAQTAPLVTFTGIRTITVDMAMPASQLTDPSGPATQRYPFASASPVTRLRYDPNEDPGARRWHLFSVRLAADCQAPHTFAVTWHDPQYRAGTEVRLYARDVAGKLYTLGSVSEVAGSNRYVVPLSSLPRGSYSVVLYVKNTSGVQIIATSSGPVVKL
jgi:hypothetical protein